VNATWNIPAPGIYTIRLTQREDGVAVDALVFQLSSLAAPTSPAESARTFLLDELTITNANDVTFANRVEANVLHQVTVTGATTIAGAVTVDQLLVDRGNMTINADLTATMSGGDSRVGLNGNANLTVNGGDVSIGTGTGIFDIAQTTTTSTASNGAANFANASSVTIDVHDLRLGTVIAAANPGGTGIGTLTLNTTGNATITANTILVADSPGAGNSTTPSVIALGGGTSTIHVDSFTVGGQKSSGTVTIGSGGTLDLDGNNNAAADLIVGDNNAAGTGTAGSGVFDMSGGTLNGTLNVTGGAVSIGEGSGNLDVGRSTAGGAAIGTLDLSGASSVVIDVTNIRIGEVSASGSGGTKGDVVLSTAGSNTVSATTITLADSDPPGNEGVTSTITLGGAANDVNVDTFHVARRKSRSTSAGR
jgi:hypothetical protein